MKIKKIYKETKILLRSIPATVVTLFVVSVVCMNLLANKTLLQLDWIALDGGILISWLSFMCMDIITKHFGPKASTIISIHAALINLLTCLIFFAASVIPSNANDYTAFDTVCQQKVVSQTPTLPDLCPAPRHRDTSDTARQTMFPRAVHRGHRTT